MNTAELTKKFGKGIIKTARDFKAVEHKIVSVSPAHDLALGGGIPQGSWVTIAGKPKTHKSSTCLHIAKKCQLMGMKVVYGNVENRLKQRDLDLMGIDQDNFHVVESSEERLMTAVDYLTVFETILKQEKETLLIIDSVSMLADEREIEGGIGTSTRGGGAKYMAQFCRNMAGVVPVRNNIVIGIMQMMANTSGYGSPFMEKGGNAIVYQADIRLLVKGSTLDEVGDKVVGATVKWQTAATALAAAPGREYESIVRYGKGIDELSELISMAESLDVISKGGAWYTMEFTGLETKKLQGIEKVRDFIEQNPPYQEAISDAVKALLT
jgi:recombination protein RecA